MGLAQARAVAVLENMEKMTREGLTLSPETIAALGRAEGRKSRWRTVALWIIAGVLATVCLVGSSKMFVPQEKMAAMGSSAQWVLDFSPSALKAIGSVELLPAAGLILLLFREYVPASVASILAL